MDITTTFDSRQLRRTLGLFGTGIAVVAVQVGDETHGMTINSFASVSLEPPLILLCLDTRAKALGWIQEAKRFSISFLGADQEKHSRRFAGQSGGEDLEEPLFWGEHPPFVTGSAGGLRCTLHQTLEAGDHWIVLGKVEGIWQSEEARGALLYFRGSYVRT